MQPPNIQPEASRPTDWFALNPVAIVAVGHPAKPGERLIGLQAAIGRFIAWVTGLRLPHVGRRTARPADRALANR